MSTVLVTFVSYMRWFVKQYEVVLYGELCAFCIFHLTHNYLPLKFDLDGSRSVLSGHRDRV